MTELFLKLILIIRQLWADFSKLLNNSFFLYFVLFICSQYFFKPLFDAFGLFHWPSDELVVFLLPIFIIATVEIRSFDIDTLCLLFQMFYFLFIESYLFIQIIYFSFSTFQFILQLCNFSLFFLNHLINFSYLSLSFFFLILLGVIFSQLCIFIGRRNGQFFNLFN